jgi:hypothetical protein
VDQFRPKSNALRQWRQLLAILCVGLVVCFATIQVVHTHPDHAASHADCSLCVAAHATAVATAPPIVVIVVSIVSRVEIASPVTRPAALLTFSLFIRPPPAVSLPA